MLETVTGASPRAIFLVVMVVLVAAFVYLDRKNVKRHHILFYRRTERGIELLDKIAKRAPRFWNYYGWGGVVLALISIPIGLAMILYTFYIMAVERSVEQGPALIAPGIGDSATFQAGVSFIPAEYWFIGIAILMVVHEMSHGIVARAEGFEINSVGWIILGIIPGAFVEPKGERMLPGDDEEDSDEKDEDSDEEDGDEEEKRTSPGIWEQGNWKSRLKVLSAGSWANYITAALFFALAFGFVYGVTAPETFGYIGILVTSADGGNVSFQAQEGYPMYETGITEGRLISVNGQSIESVEDLRDASEGIQPGQEVTVETSEGTVTVEAVENTRRVIREDLQQHNSLLEWFRQLLWTVGTLNLLIGLFNMVPIKPLDGGLIADTLLKRYVSEESALHLDTFSVLGWLFLLGAIVVSLVFGGTF